MKRKLLIFAVSIMMLITSLSCLGSDSDIENSEDDTDIRTCMQIISSLQSEITTLRREHMQKDAETQKEIDSLKAEIERLKSEDKEPPSSSQSSIFSYKLVDGKAYITGFTGNDENIVIPSEIDGFEVLGIGERAFEGYRIKSVIISNGVERIDWFAFYGCTALTSVTIPSSVTKIGYSAFDGAARSLTIYCHSNSFAESYAKSYGITYATI